MKVKEKVYDEDTRPRFKWRDARQTPVTRNLQLVPMGTEFLNLLPKFDLKTAEANHKP